MSDSSLIVPAAMAIQIIAGAVYAGIMWNRVTNLKDENASLKADLKEEREKREKGDREVIDDSDKKRDALRLEIKQDLTNARTESATGRDAVRLEVQTMFQTSSTLRAQQFTEFTKDFEKLEKLVTYEFGQVKNTLNTFSRELSDNHYRLRTLEVDAKKRGVSGISERHMPAVKQNTGYSEMNPHGEKDR